MGTHGAYICTYSTNIFWVVLYSCTRIDFYFLFLHDGFYFVREINSAEEINPDIKTLFLKILWKLILLDMSMWMKNIYDKAAKSKLMHFYIPFLLYMCCTD